jgi:hypothetical protein
MRRFGLFVNRFRMVKRSRFQTFAARLLPGYHPFSSVGHAVRFCLLYETLATAHEEHCAPLGRRIGKASTGRCLNRLLDQLHEPRRVMRVPARVARIIELNHR